MKKIILLLIILYPFSAHALEKTKEEKVAKYIIQNIQKDYVTCYSFYKVGAEHVVFHFNPLFNLYTLACRQVSFTFNLSGVLSSFRFIAFL